MALTLLPNERRSWLTANMKRLCKSPPAPLAVTVFAVFLGSCATLSEDACRQGDWFSIGAADGARGRLPDYLSRHAEACAGLGVVPVRAEWEAGRQQGLRTYCTPATAYSEGTRGRSLSPVCSGDNVERLTAANATGLRWNRLERDIDRLERDRREIAAEIAVLGPEEDSLRARLLFEDMRLRQRILALRAEQRRVERSPIT